MKCLCLCLRDKTSGAWLLAGSVSASATNCSPLVKGAVSFIVHFNFGRFQVKDVHHLSECTNQAQLFAIWFVSQNGQPNSF